MNAFGAYTVRHTGVCRRTAGSGRIANKLSKIFRTIFFPNFGHAKSLKLCLVPDFGRLEVADAIRQTIQNNCFALPESLSLF